MAVAGVEACDSGWRWCNWLAQTQLMLFVVLLCLVIHHVVFLVVSSPLAAIDCGACGASSLCIFLLSLTCILQ